MPQPSSKSPSSRPRKPTGTGKSRSATKRAAGTTAKRGGQGTGRTVETGKSRKKASGGKRRSRRRSGRSVPLRVAAWGGSLLLAGGRRLYAFAAPRVRFAHVLVALLAAVLYVHGVRVEWGSGDGGGGRGAAAGAAAPRLASFSHPADHSTADVQRLRADYIATYAPLAQDEMDAYGIPASITLAQGLLESVAGTSRLARETNNHFGIKCFSKRCAPGHCRNFGDDHHKDFFRAYDHPRDSYRAHSEFLRNGKRYARLFDLDSDDYEGWAEGLSRAGYATDPRYADKLIGLVERYGLDEYDDTGFF